MGIALALGVALMALTGTLTDWFGVRLTLKKPLTDRIVFVSDRGGHRDIWTMKPDGSDLKRLTNDGYSESEPVVSPDGYTIVFISQREGDYNQIYAIDADGTHMRRLTDITGTKSSPSFTPDGKHLLFLCAGEVWQAGRKGDHPERVLPTAQQATLAQLQGDTRAPFTWAQASPSGGVIAAVQSVSDAQVAMWMRPDDETPKPIVGSTERGAVALSGEKVCAAWASDSEMLALTLTGRKGEGVLATADPEIESVTPLLKSEAMGFPVWSPDGNYIAVEILKRSKSGLYQSEALGVADIYADSPPRILAKGSVSRLSWTPDGSRIICIIDKDICSVDVESGKLTNLTSGAGSNYDLTWAPASD